MDVNNGTIDSFLTHTEWKLLQCQTCCTMSMPKVITLAPLNVMAIAVKVSSVVSTASSWGCGKTSWSLKAICVPCLVLFMVMCVKRMLVQSICSLIVRNGI